MSFRRRVNSTELTLTVIFVTWLYASAADSLARMGRKKGNE